MTRTEIDFVRMMYRQGFEYAHQRKGGTHAVCQDTYRPTMTFIPLSCQASYRVIYTSGPLAAH
jgi:hypothetical protein